MITGQKRTGGAGRAAGRIAAILSPGGYQVAVSLLLLLAVLVYQLVKYRIPLHYVGSLGRPLGVNPYAVVVFVGLSILLVLSLRRISQLSNGLLAALAISVLAFALVAAYTGVRGIDWTGKDVPQESMVLATEVQRQGIARFLATYNDRGNPVVLNSAEYTAATVRLVDTLGLGSLARAKWRGQMDQALLRPHQHPPLFFIILGGWLRLFGNTPLSATFLMWTSVAIWGGLCFLALERTVARPTAAFLALLFVTLPTTVQLTWYPTYDVLAGLTLFCGYFLTVNAAKTTRGVYAFLGGLLLGVSVMLRFTSASLALFTAVALACTVAARRGRFVTGLLWHGAGLLLVPCVLGLAGYNPILTVVTGAAFQQVFYGSYRSVASPLLSRLPSILYLGIPLLVLSIRGLLSISRRLGSDPSALLYLAPYVAAIPLALITKLSADLPRLMIGVSACILLGLANATREWPESSFARSALVGVNPAFTTLVTAL